MLLGVMIAVAISLYRGNMRGKELTFGEFSTGVQSGKFTKDNVFELTFGPHLITFQNQPDATKSADATAGKPAAEQITDPAAKSAEAAALQRFHIPREGMPDQSVDKLRTLLEEKGIDYAGSPQATRWDAVVYLCMTLLLLMVFIMFFRRMGGAGSTMSFGRSRGRLYAEEGLKITFDDAAGIDEAVEELREIVEFLRTPGKYQALGGRIPRGVLLVGPPGTGKTLLAKAVAGEAGVPFFSLSGSDFVEMFVGVGAARVRDMFAQAVQRSPSIIFIDELDALGKTRGSGLPGGHDERDQTLNALLVEMDGFSSDQSVIVMGATNRPETLDPALLRPGRFDRHVLVDRPDYKGREAILKVHAVKVKLEDDVNLGRLAKLTPGFVGADLANLVNEAALLAARKNKSAVSMAEFEEGIERVIAGLEKTSRIIHEDEKQRVAYHESGHALVACSLPHTDPVHKISIIPRGFGALGYTLQRPEDDRHLVTQTELENRICVLLGGIAAEEVVYQETSTGAQNDLERATDLARRMVTEFGMSPRLGRMNYHEKRRSLYLGGQSATPADHVHSEATLREIDVEVKRIIDECMQTARDVLLNRRPCLEQITAELLETEVMDGEQLHRILDAHKTVPQIMPGTFVEKPARETAVVEIDRGVERREAADGA
jgi:cell division protease FtsH